MKIRKQILQISALVAVLSMGGFACSQSDSSNDTLLLLLIARTVVLSQTSPNVKWVNSTSFTGNAGLYASSTCSGSSVSGSSVSSLASGSSSSLSAFTQGTYYSGLTLAPVTCSSSSFTYSNGNNYTITVTSSGYTIATSSQ